MARVRDRAPPTSETVIARRAALRWLRAAAATLVIGSSAVAFAYPAQAPGAATGTTANLELTVMHGTKASASAVPSEWSKDLTNPPFSSYNNYVVLTTKTLALTKGAVVKESLPDGSTLEATLQDTAPKYKVELVLKDAKGAQVAKGSYSSPAGKRFLSHSTPYKGGALVVGLRFL